MLLLARLAPLAEDYFGHFCTMSTLFAPYDELESSYLVGVYPEPDGYAGCTGCLTWLPDTEFFLNGAQMTGGFTFLCERCTLMAARESTSVDVANALTRLEPLLGRDIPRDEWGSRAREGY